MSNVDRKCWKMYAHLLMDCFKFLEPYLVLNKVDELDQIYEGVLRILLLLYSDYPDFLTTYYQAFCDVIPTNCIQIRNIILAAVPKQDPAIYQSSWPMPYKCHSIADIKGIHIDRHSHTHTRSSSLNNGNLGDRLEHYLKGAAGSHDAEFVGFVKQQLYRQVKGDPERKELDRKVVHDLVFFVGRDLIQKANEQHKNGMLK